MNILVHWWPMAVVGVLYLFQCAAYILRGDYGMALAFFAYTLANIGFIWSWFRGA